MNKGKCLPVAPDSVSESSTSRPKSSTLTSVCVAVGGSLSMIVRKVSWKSTACHTFFLMSGSVTLLQAPELVSYLATLLFLESVCVGNND